MSTMYLDADLALLTPGIGETPAEARAIIGQARATAPLAKGVFGPMVLRHEDVVALLRDRRLRGPGMDFARMTGIPEGSRCWNRTAEILLFMEGEDHHRLRRLVSKAFTPRAVEALRPIARQVIGELLDAVIDRGECDAVAALCDPYPVPVICALVGIDNDRWHDMSRWASSILLSLRLDAGAYIDQIEAAMEEMDDYLLGLIDRRRTAPGDDLLSTLITVEEAGDRLSSSELLSVVAMMLVAGTDTTRNQLSNIINTFTENPDQWALLRRRPELMAAAVEEAIRWQPATEAIPRFTIEDVEIGGYQVPANTLMVLLSMSANHDPRALADADRFDITREVPDGWHLLTFGGGIHYCLGASLARLELHEALSELSSRMDRLEVNGDPRLHPAGSTIAGYEFLPIRWT